MSAYNDGMASATKTVDRSYENIKSMVINYRIRPGQHIYIEELSSKLNVSVTPIREALNRLLNDGFITRKSGRGFYNRDIDIDELTDLFQLRGSLAISAFHFILRTDLRKCIPKILAETGSGSASESRSQIPLCASMIRAIGNKEMIRIYDNTSDKIHFIWQLYAQSPRGKEQISQYRESIRKSLIDQDLLESVNIIERNINLQVSILDETIREGLGMLFSQKISYRVNDLSIAAMPGPA